MWMLINNHVWIIDKFFITFDKKYWSYQLSFELKKDLMHPIFETNALNSSFMITYFSGYVLAFLKREPFSEVESH